MPRPPRSLERNIDLLTPEVYGLKPRMPDSDRLRPRGPLHALACVHLALDDDRGTAAIETMTPPIRQEGGHTTGTGVSEARAAVRLPRRQADAQSAASPSGRRLLTLPEASVYLGLSPWTVRELTYKGTLPVVRLTRKLLFDLRDLERVIEHAKEIL